jgi:hypothetical protein
MLGLSLYDVKEVTYHVAENIPSYQRFWVWYHEEEARYRLYPRGLDEKDIEDALDYYKSSFISMVQAARKEGEVPDLIFH